MLVLVYTGNSDVLVLRRCIPKNYWQSVTGSLYWGELPGTAAERELFEETGITRDSGLVDLHTCHCFPIHAAWKHRYDPQVDHNIEHVFALCLPRIREITLSPSEHTEYRWLPKAQAMVQVDSYTNKKAILDYVSPKQDME